MFFGFSFDLHVICIKTGIQMYRITFKNNKQNKAKHSEKRFFIINIELSIKSGSVLQPQAKLKAIFGKLDKVFVVCN